MEPWKVVNTPEEAGMSSRALLDYLNAVEAAGIGQHSVMVIKNGTLAANIHYAPHTQYTPHICNSMSKPFTSVAAGFAVNEGLLHWNDRVLDVLADKVPAQPDHWLQQVTLHHLLSMSSGLDQKSDHIDHSADPDDNSESDWAQLILDYGCDARPGTEFRYNSHGTYLISCMVQRVTGMNIRDYLLPRLFTPLGIKTPRWDMSPQGICCGGWGLYLSCEDMARFGLCLLQKGQWNGRQLIPSEWFEKATQVHIATDNVPRKPEWSQGYGYQLWRCTDDRFRGDGAGGQYCIVAPKQNMVLAATALTDDLYTEFDLFNQYLFNEARQTPGSAEDQRLYAERLRTLTASGKCVLSC